MSPRSGRKLMRLVNPEADQESPTVVRQSGGQKTGRRSSENDPPQGIPINFSGSLPRRFLPKYAGHVGRTLARSRRAALLRRSSRSA
jgi:hypothetical protein